jgi:tRNA(Ile)-lysidine synthase TilS/MesJ
MLRSIGQPTIYKFRKEATVFLWSEQQRATTPLIRACIDRYCLKLTDPVVVGLSGGKDSISLVHFLREMGFVVVGVIVDLGHAAFQAEAIAASVQRFDVEVIISSARAYRSLSAGSSTMRRKLAQVLGALDCGDYETPCGLCSTAKRILLAVEAERRGAKSFCLGHHREDFVTTLLKDYFAFCYHEAIGAYDRTRFAQFVADSELDLRLLARLVESRHASTMGIQTRVAKNMSLHRPMAFIPESQIERFICDSGLKTFSAGCAHLMVGNEGEVAPSKRDIVHADWRRRLRSDVRLGNVVLDLALRALDQTGRPRANPRGVRTKLLPGFDMPENRAG